MNDSASSPTESAREDSFSRDSSHPGGSGHRWKRAPAGARQRSASGRAFEGVREAFKTRSHLFKLELRRNGISAAYIAAFAVVSALLAVTAWLLLMGAVVTAALSADLHWALAVVIVLALQSVAIFVLVRALRALIGNLTFATTRRSWSSALSKGRHGPVS